MKDLFNFAPLIDWDDAGKEGRARTGAMVVVEISVLTGRFVAVIPLGNGVATRRSRATAEEARREAELAVGRHEWETD